jgi:cytoskeletal protein RodZ
MEMEKNEKENLPEEQIAPDSKASSQPESDVQAAPAKAEKPQLSRMRRFWRASLVWLAVVAISFTAGVLIFNFLRYQPQEKELTQAYETTTDLQNQVISLTTQLKTATDRLLVLEDVQTHLELLQVLSDVNNARLALVDKDVPAAKAALVKTPQRLEDLAPKISAADASLTASLPQRLTLILSGMSNDVETAKVDLELLAGNLLDIEAALFRK